MDNPSWRVLVTGGSGYLGSALVKFFGTARPDLRTCASFLSHPIDNGLVLDVADERAVESAFREIRPDVVIHTAARMTGTIDALRRVNVAGTENVARQADRSHARLIHLSTDLVFDGEEGGYTELDPPNPILPYGRSKAEGEQAVASCAHDALIIRTSLIYGLEPVDPRTRDILTGRLSHLFTDEFRSPIWIGELCAALVELVELPVSGILHVAGPDRISRYDFGTRLVRFLGGNPDSLIPSLSRDRGRIRPRDCTLNSSRARALLETRLSSVVRILQR